MRSARALILAAATIVLPSTLALAPAALADYATDASTNLTLQQTESTLTRYGVTRTITAFVDNTSGNAAAGRPTGTVTFSIQPTLAGSFTSQRVEVPLQSTATATRSSATLTFNPDTPAQQSYTVNVTYTPQSNSGFLPDSGSGYVTIFTRPTVTSVAVVNGVATATVTASGSEIAPTSGVVQFRYGNGSSSCSVANPTATDNTLDATSATTATASVAVSGNRVRADFVPSNSFSFRTSGTSCQSF